MRRGDIVAVPRSELEASFEVGSGAGFVTVGDGDPAQAVAAPTGHDPSLVRLGPVQRRFVLLSGAAYVSAADGELTGKVPGASQDSGVVEAKRHLYCLLEQFGGPFDVRGSRYCEEGAQADERLGSDGGGRT